LADRGKAHLTNAFMEEVSRHCPMAVFPPSHKTVQDSVLDGKRIPKGTQVTKLYIIIDGSKLNVFVFCLDNVLPLCHSPRPSSVFLGRF